MQARYQYAKRHTPSVRQSVSHHSVCRAVPAGLCLPLCVSPVLCSVRLLYQHYLITTHFLYLFRNIFEFHYYILFLVINT